MNGNTDDIFGNIDAVNVKERRVSGGGGDRLKEQEKKVEKKKEIFLKLKSSRQTKRERQREK